MDNLAVRGDGAQCDIRGAFFLTTRLVFKDVGRTNLTPLQEYKLSSVPCIPRATCYTGGSVGSY